MTEERRSEFTRLCLSALFAFLPLALTAQTYSVLHTFSNGDDGGFPGGGLILDAAGNLYGTTLGGGIQSAGVCRRMGGCGVVFKIDGQGQETVLHSFSGQADGALPGGRLVRDVAGTLYGTATYGGDAACAWRQGLGCGVLLALSPTGQETPLHAFTAVPDGANPSTGVLRLPDGTMFGTTQAGGAYGKGAIYKFDSSKRMVILHSFNGSDGNAPLDELIMDFAGNLYGTTELGGASNLGVVFKLDPAGQFSVLYSFIGGQYGAEPVGGVIRDGTGNLYGTAPIGGIDPHRVCFGACGVVFKLDPLGNYTLLHSFDGRDGDQPVSLAWGRDGKMYGLTQYGGAGYGVLFRMDTAGNETVLHMFAPVNDGYTPVGQVAFGPDGSIYGATKAGGIPSGAGTVWKLAP